MQVNIGPLSSEERIGLKREKNKKKKHRPSHCEDTEVEIEASREGETMEYCHHDGERQLTPSHVSDSSDEGISSTHSSFAFVRDKSQDTSPISEVEGLRRLQLLINDFKRAGPDVGVNFKQNELELQRLMKNATENKEFCISDSEGCGGLDDL